MENRQEYEERLNAVTFGSLHAFELKKHIDFILSQKVQMNGKMKAIFQNVKVNIDRLVNEYKTVINMEEHEQLSLVFDDLNRLMLKHPDTKDVIMKELNKLIEKYEHKRKK